MKLLKEMFGYLMMFVGWMVLLLAMGWAGLFKSPT